MGRHIARSCLFVAALSAAPVAAAQSGPSAFPEQLRAPQQNVLQLKTYASGVQVYACQPKVGDSSAYEWTFKEPVAELWNERGEKIGRHYAGPTWEGNDGSKVVGQAIQRAAAPDPTAIPWLLLQAKSNAGAGVFTPVTYVQRIETGGGLAPTEGCDSAAVNTERDVDYTATYVFFVWRGDVMLDQGDNLLAATGRDASAEAR